MRLGRETLPLRRNNMLYKTLPYFVKELDVKTRMVTGIFAVHGNVDSGFDMSVNGSFAKRLNDGRSRVRFLWNHNSMNPPIASVKGVREVGREDLPAKVLEWAPEATGGVEVTRKYYEDIPLSDWVFKGIQEGDITEMSYAYDIHEYSIKEREDGQRPIRILNEVELYDISDVNWGMNPATAGVKGLPVTGTTFVQHSAIAENVSVVVSHCAMLVAATPLIVVNKPLIYKVVPLTARPLTHFTSGSGVYNKLNVVVVLVRVSYFVSTKAPPIYKSVPTATMQLGNEIAIV